MILEILFLLIWYQYRNSSIFKVYGPILLDKICYEISFRV